jgi:site-specific DNA recombinase
MEELHCACILAQPGEGASDEGSPEMAEDFNGVRFGLYTRLSQDRSNGEGHAPTSITRQDEEARELVADRGGVVVGTWSDPDASAYDERVHRPGFDDLLAAAGREEVDAVVCWAADRLTRQPAQMEQVIRLMRKSGLRLVTVKEGELDLSAGALVPRFLTWRAEAESERISQRVRSANRKLARSGQPHAGGKAPYGHRRERAADGQARLSAVPAEADVIREAAQRLVDGESLRAVAADLNTRGVATAQGGQWTGTYLRKLLLQPRLAGYRERDGEFYSAEDKGGGIEPILTDAEWKRATAILGDPSRKRADVRTARHLLTGLLRCGSCGSRMVTGYQHGRRVYICQKQNMPDACGLVSASALPLEEVVSGAWVEAFDGPELLPVIALEAGDHRNLCDEIGVLRERLGAASQAHFVEGVLSRPEYSAIRRELEARIADMERQLRRDAESEQIAQLVGVAEGTWQAASTEQRRALLRLIVDQVTVASRSSGVGRFDPSRVSVTLRT